jgi:hypothetical protein
MIPNRQIGWSTKANLLWEISNQLDKTLKSICTGPPCFTTTTTTTTAPLVLIQGLFSYEGCVPCESACLLGLIGLYTEQACIDVITVGCHIYLDLEGTNAPEGYYIRWDGPSGILYIDANGLVLNIDVCPQP